MARRRLLLLLAALLLLLLTLACRGTIRENVQQRVEERTGETAVAAPAAASGETSGQPDPAVADEVDTLGAELENLIEQLLSDSDQAEPLPQIPELEP